jgi:CRP/FNR family cyclic AMP-dependent transcriptional regulator
VTAEAGGALTPPHTAPVFCLSEVEVFQDLTDQEMADLAAHAPMRTAAAGTLLWAPHDPQKVLFIVKAGSVRIYRLSPEGRRLTLVVLGPGALFGEMELIGQRMGEGFAEALEPSVLCLMSEQDVRSMLLTDTRIATRIITSLGRRLAEVEQRLADTVLKTVPQRVAAVLCRLATAAPPEAGLFSQRAPQIRLTHEQLAELVGTTRETVTKLLGELRAAGLVRLRRGGLVVLDLPRLRAAAEHGEPGRPARSAHAGELSGRYP